MLRNPIFSLPCTIHPFAVLHHHQPTISCKLLGNHQCPPPHTPLITYYKDSPQHCIAPALLLTARYLSLSVSSYLPPCFLFCFLLFLLFRVFSSPSCIRSLSYLILHIDITFYLFSSRSRKVISYPLFLFPLSPARPVLFHASLAPTRTILFPNSCLSLLPPYPFISYHASFPCLSPILLILPFPPFLSSLPHPFSLSLPLHGGTIRSNRREIAPIRLPSCPHASVRGRLMTIPRSY